MGHGAPTVIVQTLRDIGEEGAAADSSVPGRGVHAELLKIREIDDDGAVLSAEAEVGEAVAPPARLDFEALVRGALDDGGDLVRRSRARHRRGRDAERGVVRLDRGELVERIRRQ